MSWRVAGVDTGTGRAGAVILAGDTSGLDEAGGNREGEK